MSKFAYNPETGKIIAKGGKICTTCCGYVPCNVRFPDPLVLYTNFITICSGWAPGWTCFPCPPFPWIQYAGDPNPNISGLLLTKNGTNYSGKFGGNNGTGGGPQPGMGDWIGNWEVSVDLSCIFVDNKWKLWASVLIYCKANVWVFSPPKWAYQGSLRAFYGQGYITDAINNTYVIENCGKNSPDVYDNFQVGYGGNCSVYPA